MNPPHAHITNERLEWSFEVAPKQAVRVSSQAAVRILELESQPQPDVAWLLRKDYSQTHPAPVDVLLLIEVADSSLNKDQGAKLELHAEANIQDYWVVNVQNRSVDVYRDPSRPGFRTRMTYVSGQEIRPLAFPDLVLPVSRLFAD